MVACCSITCLHRDTRLHVSDNMCACVIYDHLVICPDETPLVYDKFGQVVILASHRILQGAGLACAMDGKEGIGSAVGCFMYGSGMLAATIAYFSVLLGVLMLHANDGGQKDGAAFRQTSSGVRLKRSRALMSAPYDNSHSDTLHEPSLAARCLHLSDWILASAARARAVQSQ